MSENETKPARLDLADAAILAGAASVVYGLSLFHPALGYIVAGLGLAAVGILRD
jgi:hypothetical protein